MRMRAGTNRFAGMQPATAPTQLEDFRATDSYRAWFPGGVFTPLKAPNADAVGYSVSPKTLWIDTQFGLTYRFANPTDIVKAPAAGSTKAYFVSKHAGSADPIKVIDLNTESTTHASVPDHPTQVAKKAGIPAPTVALTLPGSIVEADLKPHLGTAGYDYSDSNLQERSYVYTFVIEGSDETIVESAPSPSTLLAFMVYSDSQILVTFPTGMVQTPTDYGTITHIYVYRTLTGSAYTDYQYVGKRAWADYVTTPALEDQRKDEQLGETLQSRGWDVPPSPMTALVALPTGPLAGIYKDYVCFTPPFQGFTFPVEYYQRTQYKPVALAVLGADVVVLTDGAPCIMSGASPEQLQQINIQSIQPCMSNRAVAFLSGAVVYACPDGVAAIEGPGPVQVISSEIMTRDYWRLLQPSTMIFHVHDGMLYFYSDAPTIGGLFVIDFVLGALTKVGVGAVQALFYDAPSDRMGYVAQAATVRTWLQDAGALRTDAYWRSKHIICHGMTTPRWVLIRTPGASSSDITLTLTDETLGTTLVAVTVTSNTPVRLPVRRSNLFSYKLVPTTGAPISGCWFADSPGEFNGT
jgi:hypothetical protein